MIESSSEEPLPVRVVSESIGEYIGRLGPVWVEGEVAEITRRPGSQMAFIRLKDMSVDISLQVTCHKSILEAIDPLPDNARIVAYAKVNWYAVRGTLSLMAREIRQVGLGELLARLEQLKNLLAAEGLFSAERKKELPFLPRKIGLICGRASAAEQDVADPEPADGEHEQHPTCLTAPTRAAARGSARRRRRRDMTNSSTTSPTIGFRRDRSRDRGLRAGRS